MSRHYKEMIKEINDGKNLEIMLPKYTNELSSVFNEYAMLQLSLEYYGLKEMLDEKLEAYEEVTPLVNVIEEIVDLIFSQNKGVAEREALINKIDKCRNHVIQKMEVLTMYTDKLQIYEYVLNRKELEYATEYPVIDEEAFKQQLLQYIFGSKDNYVVNERIKESVGQLPIRLTKSKFYDYLKDSLSIYKESDKASVDSYLYMIKTCAMLYSPENVEDNDYANLKQVIGKLSNVTFDQLTKEEYQQLCSQVLDSSLFINQITDLYLVVQKVLNYLYVYVLSLPYAIDQDVTAMEACNQIITEVHSKFKITMTEEMIIHLHGLFERIEGKQEIIFDKYMLLASVLASVKENHLELVEAIGLSPAIECMLTAEQLCNTSVFIDIHKKQESFPIDSDYVEYQTEQLIAEFMELFKGNPQCVNRAIMASTLSKMPVFFHNSDEVVSYVHSSLEQCHKLEEKTVAMRLLLECIEDAANWSV